MGWLHAVIDVPADLHGRTATFWSSVLGWPLGKAWEGHPELRSFEPPDGDPYVHVQQIDGLPRVHLDVESEHPERTIAHAVDGGAEVVGRFERWVALRSPGGLPFCVIPRRDRIAPLPVTWADGHRSRLVQVCIDSPVSQHDREVPFWRALLGGRWVGSDSPEFAGKWHDDDGSPIQLLFQRLDEPTGQVRAHLDLGTDDQAAEVQRLLDAGALDRGLETPGWRVFADPAGLAFCSTVNAPDQTTHRELS